MKFGDFEINHFVESLLRFDGGAMFGLVPKTIWSKMMTPDENNLIGMCNNFFVLKAHGKNIVFDVGIGDTLSDKEKKVYGTDGVSSISSGLSSLGLSEADIDYIILTHLHTDHMAGAIIDNNGQLESRFKNATIYASKREFEAATNPNERTAAIYKAHRVNALNDSGQLQLIDGNEELFPGIKTFFTGGHSEGHFGIEMESGGQKVFFYSDLLPMSQNMPIPYIAALDIYPMVTLEVKQKKIPEIVADDVTMLFVHDLAMPMAKVRQENEKISVIKFDES